MTTRAGLVSRIALGAVLIFSAFALSAQAAPIPVQGSAIQILPVTAPVPNVHFTNHRQEDLVHLQVHSQLGSAPTRGTIHVHDHAHDSSALELVRRKGGGGHGHTTSPPPAAHPAPAQHNAAPPPAHHHESIAAKIRHGISHAFHAVTHFIKTTGAKIAKVALKVVATAQKIASKVVGWLPGIGKPLGKIMEGESEGLNKASDAIHAHIGGKLGQAMHRMDHAQKIVGYIPRSYIPERFEERGFEDLEEFEDRELAEEVEERETDWENIAERGMDDEEVFMF